MLSKKDYNLIGITKATAKNKKYSAYLKNKKTGKIKKINFGDIRYEHYYDKLGLYSHLNHLDKKRRRNYIKRHSVNSFKPYSANYFSKFFLW